MTQTGGATYFNGGGLVGENRSTISASDTTADVSAPSGNNVGGLAGYNNGTIEDSSASGTVEGDDVVGGFVGEQAGSNGATIEESYAAGAVTGVDNGQILSADAMDGFIEANQPNNSISKSYATGTVDAPDSEEVGGFVGNNGGTVETSYATGGVTGDNSVGGFAGENGKLVFRTCATGGVTGNTNVGGLVGRLRGSSPRDGVLEDSYFDDSSTGTGQTDAVGVIAPYGNTAEKRGEVKGLSTTDMQGNDASQNLSTFSFSSFEAEPPASTREGSEIPLTIRTGLRPVNRSRHGGKRVSWILLTDSVGCKFVEEFATPGCRISPSSHS